MITPTTFIVGAGPVATALAGALRLGGVPVLGLWARRAEPARVAAAVAGVAGFSAGPPDLLLESAAVIFAVRDDAIAEVAQTVVDSGLVTPNHVFVHCSGAVAAEQVFAAVRDRVGGVAVMHPLRAIPDGGTAMRDMRGTVFGIQGDAAGRDAVRALVAAMDGRALELTGEQMSAYHGAAVMASNYFVTLMDAAAAMLESAGVGRDDALAALLPLVEGTLANLRTRGLSAALTGPIRRGDRETVARHLEALGELPEGLGALYRALGRRTVALARECGDAEPATLDAIDALLADGR